MLRHICIALILGFSSVSSYAQDNIDKVNGSIHLEANQTGGNLTTVNGSIHLGDGAQAGGLETVNGSIELGNNAGARSVETVNGHVTLGENAHVTRTVEAVNGALTLEHGADVAGKLSNVNGVVTVNAAHVGGGVETASGDVEIGAESHVEGGLLIDEPSGISSWFAWFERKPRIVIGPHTVVAGKLDFRRDVDLYVSDSATIGPVSGAKPIPFTGANPPLQD